MTDPNHTWNNGAPILAEQSCGCHITADTFKLCMEGRENKKSADEGYRLWLANKDTAVDAMIIRAMWKSFEIHRDAYLRHLETGKTWVL